MKMLELFVVGTGLTVGAASLLLPVAANSTTKPDKPAAIVVSHYVGGPYRESDGIRFSCENAVLRGRLHVGDENGDTYYICGDLEFNGKPVSIQDKRWSEQWGDPGRKCDKASSRECNHKVLCPLNRIMTGRYHRGDENEHTEYECAQVADASGNKLYVVPQGDWVYDDEPGYRFICPDNTVLIGRSHEGDENGRTGYFCGSLH